MLENVGKLWYLHVLKVAQGDKDEFLGTPCKEFNIKKNNSIRFLVMFRDDETLNLMKKVSLYCTGTLYIIYIYFFFHISQELLVNI